MPQGALRAALLSRLQELVPGLNAAEVHLIEALWGDSAAGPYPEGSEIRAAVISSALTLHARENGTGIASPQGLTVLGTETAPLKITGTLDLDCFDISLPLIFRYCDFSGNITLCDAKTKGLEFSHCAIAGISAQNARVKGNLILSNSTFSGGASFRRVCVHGDLRLTGAELRRFATPVRLDVDRADIGGTLYLNSETETKRFTCSGEVSLKGIFIRGNLNCEGGFFENPAACPEGINEDFKPHSLVANQCIIHGNMYLRKGRSIYPFESHGQVLIIESEIFGKLDCEGAILRGSEGNDDALATDRTRIRGSAYLWHCDSFGQIHFRGTRIDGDLHLTAGRFFIDAGDYHAPLDLQRVNVEGTLFLGEIRTREVYLPGARIGADLDLTNATFTFEGDDDVSPCPAGTGNSSKGSVGMDAYGAVIGGELKLDGISFIAPRADPAGDPDRIPPVINLEGASATRLSLPWADRCSAGLINRRELGKELHRPDLEADPAAFFKYYLLAARQIFEEDEEDRTEAASSAGRPSLRQLLARTHEGLVASLLLREEGARALKRRALRRQHARSIAWSQQRWTVKLKGFTFLFVNGCDSKDLAYRWLDCTDFDTQPYDRLAAVLARKGREGMARDVLVRKERLRRKQVPWWYRFDKYLLGGLYRISVGYGYRPERALRWAGAIILLGWFLFDHAYDKGWFAPNEIEAYSMLQETRKKTPPTYVAFSPLLYTLDVFVPTLDLGQKKNWHPVQPRSERNRRDNESETDRLLNWIAYGYHPVAVVLGWLLIAIALLGPIGIVKKSVPEA